uniref:Uncharacterized protein n=1 Tax=Nelumbo nucifera TaxID=4432 RepID=A0A822Z1B4_NELNU|nr:TPA_asm: hypothetical protein HUJ06_007930 [Nelumbo nucifera]
MDSKLMEEWLWSNLARLKPQEMTE